VRLAHGPNRDDTGGPGWAADVDSVVIFIYIYKTYNPFFFLDFRATRSGGEIAVGVRPSPMHARTAWKKQRFQGH
jgi:hypothetical protein